MNLIARAATLLCLVIFLSSCSAYRSTGRKNFESKAAQSNVTASSSATSSETTCWNQPVDEPLWNLTESTTLTVTKINEDEIQVCATQL